MSYIKLLLLDPPRNMGSKEREIMLLSKKSELTDKGKLPFSVLVPISPIKWRLLLRSQGLNPLVESSGSLRKLSSLIASLPNCCLATHFNQHAKVEGLLKELGHYIHVFKV